MKKFIKIQRNRGMSYAELIVVLSIFAVMTSVSLYSYGGFQDRVAIKNLASDIALKLVEAQKSSLSGQLPPVAQQLQTGSNWKPSYGVYIDRISDNKSFTYFTDLNAQNNLYDISSCPGNDECLSKITITKGNIISSLDVFYNDTTTAVLNDLTVLFSRIKPGAVIKSSQIPPSPPSPVYYVQITILSPKGSSAKIIVYPSGRIQIN